MAYVTSVGMVTVCVSLYFQDNHAGGPLSIPRRAKSILEAAHSTGEHDRVRQGSCCPFTFQFLCVGFDCPSVKT